MSDMVLQEGYDELTSDDVTAVVAQQTVKECVDEVALKLNY